MAQLAIKGHATRGNEVIEILKILGGSNRYDYSADNDGLCFYINKRTNIIDYDWVNNCYEDEDTFIFTLEEFLEVFPYRVGDKVQHKGATSCGTVYVIERMKWVNNHIEYEIRPLYDYNHTGLVTLCVESLQLYKEETMEETIIDTIKESADRYRIKVNYQFDIEVDEGEYYAVRRKLPYPKTYEECCKVLLLKPERATYSVSGLEYERHLIVNLQRLLICRDAYWKIAGEQMGLGKPWKPDWEKADERKYCIVNTEGNVAKWVQKTTNKILAFPTEEIRDEFYENFKGLIGLCKELL